MKKRVLSYVLCVLMVMMFMPTAAMAKSPESGSISFDLCNGDVIKSETEPENYIKGQTLWGDYVFDGWFTARTGGAEAADGFTADTTYYAHWKTGKAEDSNYVLTEGIKIENGKLYVGGIEPSADTLALYGISFNPARGGGAAELILNDTVIDGTSLVKIAGEDLFVNIASSDNLNIVLKGTNGFKSYVPKNAKGYNNSGIYVTANLNISGADDGAKLSIKATPSEKKFSDGIHVFNTFTNSAALDADGGSVGVNVNKLVNSGKITAKGSEAGVKVVGADSGSNKGMIDASTKNSEGVSSSGMYVTGNFTNDGSIKAVGSSYGLYTDIDYEADYVFVNNGTLYAQGARAGVIAYEGFSIGPKADVTAKTTTESSSFWPVSALSALPLTVSSELTMEGSSKCSPKESELESVHIEYGSLLLPDNYTKPVYVHIYDAFGGKGIFVNGEEFGKNKDTIVCGKGTASLTEPSKEGEPYILTLKNAEISNSSANDTAIAESKNICGIYSEHDLKIVLSGENYIIPKKETKADMYNSGIHAEKNLIIKSADKTASLTVMTPNADEFKDSFTTGIGVGGDFENYADVLVQCSTAQGLSAGISVSGKLTNFGNLNVKSGAVTKDGGISSGIYMNNDPACIENNGDITAKGGNVSAKDGKSYGIYGADRYRETNIVNNSRMSVSGGDGCRTYGIYLSKGGFTNNGKLSASGGTVLNGAENGECCGIYTEGDFTNCEYSEASVNASSDGIAVGIWAAGKIKAAANSLLTARASYCAAVTTALETASKIQVQGSADKDSDGTELSAVILNNYAAVMEEDTSEFAKYLKLSNKPGLGFGPGSGFSIIFDANGGSGEIKTPASLSLSGGYTLPPCSFEAPAGKQFRTWAAGSPKGAQYPAGSEYNIGADVTFYALWEDAAAGSYGNCLKDESCPIERFTDTKNDGWYHDGIHYCLDNGLMTGVSKTKFDPSGSITRAMIVTMLWRLEGSPALKYAMTFKDVAQGKWYTDAIRWAQAENIVSGYNEDTFGPNDSVTREQLATILYNYAKYKGQGFTGKWMFDLDFGDKDKISSWADEAVHWCSLNGIVNGKTGNLFDPEGSATRAEAAAMMQRFCERI